jgi:hypothetical protein
MPEPQKDENPLASMKFRLAREVTCKPIVTTSIIRAWNGGEHRGAAEQWNLWAFNFNNVCAVVASSGSGRASRICSA